MRPVCFAGPRHDIIMRMKASAVGKVGVEVKRAYLAGLIDGDGCIMATIERHHEKKFGFRVRVEVKITQKESELLKSLAQEFKIGRVSRNNKPSVDYATHDWIIRDKKHVIQILEYIEPYTRLNIFKNLNDVFFIPNDPVVSCIINTRFIVATYTTDFKFLSKTF